MLNEGSGTSPTGARPRSTPRPWLDLRRLEPTILELVVRVVILACLWGVIVAAATIWNLIGG